MGHRIRVTLILFLCLTSPKSFHWFSQNGSDIFEDCGLTEGGGEGMAEKRFAVVVMLRQHWASEGKAAGLTNEMKSAMLGCQATSWHWREVEGKDNCLRVGTAIVRKIPRNWRETCLNGSVSHRQEFVEQKEITPRPSKAPNRELFYGRTKEGREHRADRVITTLVIPDPHSQEPVPLSSSSSSSSSMRDINSSVLFSRQRGSGYLRVLRMTDSQVCKELHTCWQDLTSQNNSLTSSFLPVI